MRAPDFFTATRTQPQFATFLHELRRLDRRRMRSAAEPRDCNSPFVAHRVIDSHASLRIRNILHWPTNMHDASVVVAHESLVLHAPARQIRWQGVVPEINRRLNKIIGKHAAADYSRIVMVELD